MKVLEIGCRDSGVLLPFLEAGCHITGFDLYNGPVEKSKIIYAKDIQEGRAEFLLKTCMIILPRIKIIPKRNLM
jgi:hypothetical protein